MVTVFYSNSRYPLHKNGNRPAFKGNWWGGDFSGLVRLRRRADSDVANTSAAS